jgi:hypothetical protein
MPGFTSFGVHVAYHITLRYILILSSRLLSDRAVKDTSVTPVYSDMELLCLEHMQLHKFHMHIYYCWGMPEA